jgi:hypothetical protein
VALYRLFLTASGRNGNQNGKGGETMDFEAIRGSKRRGIQNAPDDRETDTTLLLLSVIKELSRIRKLLEQQISENEL